MCNATKTNFLFPNIVGREWIPIWLKKKKNTKQCSHAFGLASKEQLI
jgi:hypothetical protein